MQHKTDLARKSIWLAAFSFLFAVALIPFAKNGFWADDALNSQTWGMVNRFHSSVWEFSYRVSHVWLVNYGRILFPWPAIYGFFYVMRDELAARLADLALFVGHISITVLVLRRLGINWRTLGFFALALLALMQIRDSNDPLAAYAGFSQVVGILLMLSLLLLCKWYQTQAAGWLIASSLLATLSMTCYEINAVYVPISIAAILMSEHRKKLRNLAIVILPFAAFLAINIYVKCIALTPYDGSKVGHLSAIPVTFLKQLVATLPGSFYVLSGRLSLSPQELFAAAVKDWLTWGVVILWVAIAIKIMREESRQQSGMRMATFAASMLLLVPPTLIAISAKYQASLNWGGAHVPVYYQCFGLAFLLAAMGERALTHARANLSAIAILVIGLYVGLNWSMNMHQSTSIDVASREPRDSLVAALKQGLFEGVSDGDIVQIDDQPIFINGNLIYQTTEINVSIPNETAIAGWFESPPRHNAKRYRLFRDTVAGNQWKIQEQ